MALVSGEPDSASSAFFFNLADNSTNLDNQNGGFTVFGRILSGTNILQYFNTLSAPSNGISDFFSDLPTLPVNFDGAGEPSDANLFYCDFAFQTTPPVDTNRPAISIAFPAANAAFTNGSPLTVQGTARDDVGLAEVFCILTSPTGAYGGALLTNAALGTTNWSLDLVSSLGTIEPGIYQLRAFAQDGAGNLSAPATVYFTNLAQLTIITNVNGQLASNAQYLVPGQRCSLSAAPGPGQQFFSWTSNGVTSLNPVQTFTVKGNLTLTVTYLITNLPAGLTIASPVSGKQALSVQSLLAISGTIASTNATQVTCQLFVNSNSVSAAQPAIITGTNWSLTLTNYPNGSYSLIALATNAAGESSFASARFTLLNVDQLEVNIVGQGTVTGNPGAYVVPGAYTVKAVPGSGQAFYSWSDGVTTTSDPSKTFNIVSNMTLTATFVPEDTSLKGMTITYPPANAGLTNGTFNVAGSLPAGKIVTRMTCQLFLLSNGLTALPQPVALAPAATNWSFPASNLAPGPYTVLAMGYDNKGNARLVSENFNVLAKLTVLTQPPGAGSVTSGLNGKYLQTGISHSITATPASGRLFAYWTGAVADTNSAATTFVMSNNMVLTANFASNLFPSVQGTYTGLFLDPGNVSPSTAGYVSITTRASGAFSGQLVFPARTYQLSWAFPYYGAVELRGVGMDSNILAMVFSLDLTNGTDTITGYIADQPTADTYLWASELVLHRSVTQLPSSNAPAPGNYVLLLQQENAADGPGAAGYLAATLGANGGLSLKGALPDNSSISTSANISKDGIWPVFVVPSNYKNKGMLIGWQTNSPSGAGDGRLYWFPPSSGFATDLISTGAKFSAPAAGTQYRMVLAGETNALTVSPAGQFTPRPPVTQISLQSTGVLTGQIDVGNEKLPFKGAFVSPSAGGAGFILETNGLTTGFQIPPQP